MSSDGRHSMSDPSSRRLVPLRMLVVSLFFLMLTMSCGLVVSFDSYGTIDKRDAEMPLFAAPSYSVGGTVDGLDGKQVTLLLGDVRLETGDGPFVFHPSLPDGSRYAVTIEADPLGHACSVEAGTGTVAGADLTNVVVHCPSTDATLTSLTLSAAPLAPGFTPATLAYGARIRTSGVLAEPRTTVTPTAHHVGARITVAGAVVASGAASAPTALKPGPNPIDITVTAADQRTRTRYTVVISVDVNDYVKSSNTQPDALFGGAIAVSGNTLAVSSTLERSAATGIDGNQTDMTALRAGAVYIFVRTGTTWSQQAYVKASNTRAGAGFGSALALAGDTLVVGSSEESSSATGINGEQSNTAAPSSGAVYVFTRVGPTWSQQAYLKPSNTRPGAFFGSSIALSGETLAVGSASESSNAIGIDGDEANTSAAGSGAAYVFIRSGTAWSQQAYVKASTSPVEGFAAAVALAGDTLVVGSVNDPSNAMGINGNQGDTSLQAAGAVYVFTRNATTWSQQAYVKPSNTQSQAYFGSSVAIAGNTIVVGSPGESSNATGINGNQSNRSAIGAGAVYEFSRNATTWSQTSYIKASTTRASAYFGWVVALSGDTLAVGAIGERSSATGINGNESIDAFSYAGAAYVLTRAGGSWTQRAYVKASNTRETAYFGQAVTFAGDTLFVGAPQESSGTKGINGNPIDTSAPNAGAVYVY